MTLSSASINKKRRTPSPQFWGAGKGQERQKPFLWLPQNWGLGGSSRASFTFSVALAGLGLLVCAGCADHAAPQPPRTVSGYASLSVLVQSRPGWRGLQRYDAALARLDGEVRSLPAAAGQADPKLAVLPALTFTGAAGAGGQGTLLTGQRLSAIEASLVSDLEDRRQMARAEQIRRQQELWRREARRLFPVPARTAEIGSDLDLQLLEANVAALSQTLAHWDNSVPPAPKLVQLKRKVEADRTRLQALIAGRIQTREAARAARAEMIKQTRQARLDYVSAQDAALSARLQAEDDRALSSRTLHLGTERQALLTALAAPEPAAVPAAGNTGVLALPRGPAALPATLSADSLRAARASLLAQRGRWAQYLYDDTRASAQDAAGKKHWNLTFGPPRPGDRNLTADLEQALGQG